MLLEWPVYHLFRLNGMTSSETVSATDTLHAAETLALWESCRVDDAQQHIDNANAAYERELTEKNITQRIENTIKKIEKGKLTYREVLSDVYVCGDSLMAELSVYGLVNGNHLMAKVSANLKDLRENLPMIQRVKPKILILHYGINAISSKKGRDQQFADNYRKLIEQIRESCPKTRIIVSLLFPVNTSIARDKRFTVVDQFNECLKQMCSELNIEYLDNSSLEEQCREYAKGDGIHMERDFYTKYWGKHIIREMRIYK